MRRYETELEDARAKIRELREQEEMAVARLERAKGQLEEAQGKRAGARDRMSAVSVSGGLGDPFSMSEQVQAGRDAEAAQADIDIAQKQIDAEREEIRELRKDARREETELIDAETTAAATVRAAAAGLPDIQLPGGAASPSAYGGLPFGGSISPMARDPRWASAMQNAAANDEPDDENGGGKGLSFGEDLLDALGAGGDSAKKLATDTYNAAGGSTNATTGGLFSFGDPESEDYEFNQKLSAKLNLLPIGAGGVASIFKRGATKAADDVPQFGVRNAGPNRAGTRVPESFDLDVAGRSYRVHHLVYRPSR